ncbi:MAG: hypothetical protein CSA64_02265 [Arachnia propionica]|nr:MAG: hypothetical protein CSA64_02265 [Arachnia propionica]
MLWIWIFAAIGLIGLIVVVGYAVWLFHQAGDIASELQQLRNRTAEATDLLARIEFVPAKRQ